MWLFVWSLHLRLGSLLLYFYVWSCPRYSLCIYMHNAASPLEYFTSVFSQPHSVFCPSTCVSEPAVCWSFSLSLSTLTISVDLLAVIKYQLWCLPWKQECALCFQPHFTFVSILFHSEEVYHFSLSSHKAYCHAVTDCSCYLIAGIILEQATEDPASQ